jgi:lipopolysaccharide transport system ATP-binding protein
VIEVSNLSKCYKVYPRRSDRLREWLRFGSKKLHSEYWALKDVSFNVGSGKVLSIVGMNGAGKSTLLKILTGTTFATSGRIQLRGRVAALLELGTGFHQELSGRENVFINGRLLGLSDEQIRSRIGEIHAFSELGDFFDKPVRTYSSGMYVRLAFSLASSVEPDVLIIDEALSVGDAYFQQKSLERIRQFRKSGTTILFVSHDLSAVKMLSDEVLLLDGGKVRAYGNPTEVLELYNASLGEKSAANRDFHLHSPLNGGVAGTSSGNMKATFSQIEVLDRQNRAQTNFVTGDEASIHLAVEFHSAIQNPSVGFLIRDRLGYDVFGTNTVEMQKVTGSFAAGENATFSFRMPLNIGPGEYTLSVAIHSGRTHESDCYHWKDRVALLKILPRSDYHFLGVAALSPEFTLSR